MKTKNFAYFLILMFLLPAIPMQPVAAMTENISLFNNGGLDFDHGPIMYQALDSSELEISSLPTVTPYWTDLVNTENVANDGTGVYVAVLDTGLLSNWPVLFNQADIAWELGKGFSHDIYWDDSIENIVVGPLREDRGFLSNLASGHGTHVTSTIVGFNVNNAFWVEGVAPGVTIIPVLVLDAWEVSTPGGLARFSGGTNAMVAAGIYYIAELADELDAPIVINMSLGGGYSQLIEDAIDYAISKGVIIVASAGNSGYNGMGYPGALPQSISVGAAGWAEMFLHGWNADVPERLNQKDSLGNKKLIYLEDFSSRPNSDLGQKTFHLDVSAPGAWIVGPYKSAFANNFGYYYLSGTSMAAPHVSAIAALVLESYPGVDQSMMEFILKRAANGEPLPSGEYIVAFPFVPEGYYTVSWTGGEYGSGFLKADSAIQVAHVHAK
jgi:subtilisin family serine protease